MRAGEIHVGQNSLCLLESPQSSDQHSEPLAHPRDRVLSSDRLRRASAMVVAPADWRLLLLLNVRKGWDGLGGIWRLAAWRAGRVGCEGG